LCTELALALLSEADIADYLHTCFPVNALPSGLARTLYRRTEGNPLFLVNTLDDLIARGIITQDEGRWVLRDGVKVIELGVPESIRQLIVKQSERLLPAERQVLEAASVAGMQFSAAAVAAALEADVVEVEELCAGLAQRQQFLRPAGISEWPDGTVAARYGFLHALYQEVLYEGVTTGKWARLHQRIGKRLEVAYRNRTEEVAVELAIHFEQGRDISRAVRYLGQAAENALRRSANVEAITHLTKGLELLTLLPDTPARARHELTFQLALGAPLTATKGWAAPEVGNAYRRARELCQRVGNAQQLFQALFGLWVFAYTRAELRPARELAEQLLSLARKSRDAVLLTEAHHALGNTLHRMGELTIARTHLEQGLVLSESRQAHPYALLYGLDNGVAGLGYVTWVLWQLGYPDQALQRAQAMLLRARQSAYPLSMAWALNAAAWHHQARREGRQAQEQAETEIVLCHEQGFSQLGAVGTIARGWALAVQGQAEEGIGQMRQGLADHRATGAEIGRPRYLALLAEAYGQAGQAAEGLRVLDEALKTAHDTGERFYEAELYRLKGELTLQQFKVQSSRFKVKTSPNQVEGKSKPSRGKSGVQKLHH
jgi:predicted ATPase